MCHGIFIWVLICMSLMSRCWWKQLVERVEGRRGITDRETNIYRKTQGLWIMMYTGMVTAGDSKR